jgi:segregation and condensation protein B
MELKFILESILFSAQRPLSAKELRDLLVAAAEHGDESGEAKAFKKTPLDNINSALDELAREHETAQRSYRLACVAGSWQFVSQPEYAAWIKALVGHKNRQPRLSQPALETLAIIAYRQPITRAEIEQVRGVAVDGVMQTLVERGLVEQVGRAEVIGRPITYGTTHAFLEYFGLKALDDLPAADELRRIPVTKPESLLTVDPGLATAPPEQLQEMPAQTVTENNGSASANGHASAEPAVDAPAAPVATAADPEPPEAALAPQPKNRLSKRRPSPPPAE